LVLITEMISHDAYRHCGDNGNMHITVP